MTNNCCSHGASKKHTETIVGKIERPLFAPGLILQDSDLTSAVDYTRDLNRLLFSQLFGCGVICGLNVSVDTQCDLQVIVAPGLALNSCGDPLQVTRPATIKLGRGDGVLPTPGQDHPEERLLWVTLCGGEKSCAPRATVCDGDDLDPPREPTRARALVEVSVSFERPKCACACTQLPSDNYAAYVKPLLPLGPIKGAPAKDVACHKEEEKSDACVQNGCDVGCSCGGCVLLALVFWFAEEKKWGVVHKGVRRFIRPKLLEDPITDHRPPKMI